MAGNTFGKIFRLTTFGESHGPAVGGIIDGMPPRVSVDTGAVAAMMARRRPGASALSTQRNESDEVEILSGMADGLDSSYATATTGRPTTGRWKPPTVRATPTSPTT